MEEVEQIETMFNPLYSLIMFEEIWDVKISLLYGRENMARLVTCRWKGIKIMEATRGSVYWCLPFRKTNDIFDAFEEFVKPIFASKITPLRW